MSQASQTRERNNYWRNSLAESEQFIRENCAPAAVEEESKLCPFCGNLGADKQDGYWYCKASPDCSPDEAS